MGSSPAGLPDRRARSDCDDDSDGVRPGGCGCGRVRARSDSSGSDLTITPVGPTTGRLDVAVDPGQSVQRSFVVANRSSTIRLTVRLAGVDATASAGDSVTYAHGASNDGPGSWISLSDVVSTIEPGAQVRVSVNVAPPATVDPGNVMAGVVATVDQATPRVRQRGGHRSASG